MKQYILRLSIADKVTIIIERTIKTNEASSTSDFIDKEVTFEFDGEELTSHQIHRTELINGTTQRIHVGVQNMEYGFVDV